MTDDPERLLSEALRAQARNAPPQQPAPPSEPLPVVETPGGYGLLSGAGEGSLERERAALDALPPAAPAPAQTAPPTRTQQAPAESARPLAARWVLLLAAVLGLAAGAVVGLLTLL